MKSYYYHSFLLINTRKTNTNKCNQIKFLTTTTTIGTSNPLQLTTSRLMNVDDANPTITNVHGGTILQMIEETSMVLSTRFFNRNRPLTHVKDNKPIASALARIDQMDFKHPIHVGELASIDAKLTFTQGSSVECTVNVTGEDLQTSQSKITNSARLWFVAVEESIISNHDAQWKYPSKLGIPPKLQVVRSPFQGTDVDTLRKSSTYQQSLTRYNNNKLSRSNQSQEGGGSLEPSSRYRRPNVTQPVITHIVHPSDCHPYGTCMGGVIMKLMDTAAGVSAVSFTKKNAVTASLDALNFASPVFLGNSVRVYCYPTYTSSKSLELAAYVEAEDMMNNLSWHVTSALFTMVAINKDGTVAPIPQFIPTTHEERMDFKAGEERYKRRKAEREKKIM
jgi:acyl-coenzyme A thioesterase 7